MRTEKFFMPMIPPSVTHQAKKLTVTKKRRPILHDTPELKDAIQKLEAHLSKHKPSEPFAGPVRLVTQWFFPITGKHLPGTYKTTKPDSDNSHKMLKDCMTRLGWWLDDAHVASDITEKFWTPDIPGILVEVIQL
jgi:Holliday junction resolvase RusA-like endonuclease